MTRYSDVIDPFGLPDCESEVELLGKEYSDIFFDETPFNAPALDPRSYLIIGRRGSGKTALAQYFSFQTRLRNPHYIDVDEPAAYQEVLLELTNRSALSAEIAIGHLVRVWEIVIWNLIFDAVKADTDAPEIAVTRTAPKAAGFIGEVISWIGRELSPDWPFNSSRQLERFVESTDFEAAQNKALAAASRRPIIIACDTLERNPSDEGIMQAIAALVQFASRFNLRFRSKNIHLKVFIAGEVFTYLRESVILNPAKSVRHPVYLLWRPKDLLRLISWRFYKYLLRQNLLSDRVDIDWEDYRSVFNGMWAPYFGREITNSRGHKESTWPYVLRHTQMRPRQVIALCNKIAERSLSAGRFPTFNEEDIRLAVREEEAELANEIINSFSTVYPGIAEIIKSLDGLDMTFDASELDRRAKRTKSAWPAGHYSLDSFRRLISEIGAVGRVRRIDRSARYIAAEFEYSAPERISLIEGECVVHPMFYRLLRVRFNRELRVMPFSTEQDLEEVVALE